MEIELKEVDVVDGVVQGDNASFGSDRGRNVHVLVKHVQRARVRHGEKVVRERDAREAGAGVRRHHIIVGCIHKRRSGPPVIARGVLRGAEAGVAARVERLERGSGRGRHARHPLRVPEIREVELGGEIASLVDALHIHNGVTNLEEVGVEKHVGVLVKGHGCVFALGLRSGN